MQCVNCHFHNMPGSSVCGRCGTSLGLSRASEIDVHPPRAGAATLTLRRIVPYYTWNWRLRAAAAALQAQTSETRRGVIEQLISSVRRPDGTFTDGVTSEGLIFRAIVPGWPQWYAEQRWQGGLFFLLYITLMPLGIANILHGGEGVLLGLGFAVHVASWIDVVYQIWRGDSFIIRFGRAILTSLVLMMLVYAPPTLLMSYVATPTRAGYTAGRTLVAGDVLLVNALMNPSPGRVVVYQTAYLPGRPPGHDRAYGFQGRLLDRVIAGPGDHVVCRGGGLTVNGKIPAHLWLDDSYKPVDLDVIVPPNAVFIVPSNLPTRADRSEPDLRTISIVSQSDIVGVVWTRVSPWSRAGRL